MKKIYIALPAYNMAVTSLCAQSLFALGQRLMAMGILGGIVTLSIADIVEARNVFLSLFFDKTDATHILFIDADMQFSPDMIADMILFDMPLVGAIYPAKILPPVFVGRPLGDPPYEVVNGFMKVDGVGGGLMLVRRDCVEIMDKAYPELTESVNRGFITHPIIKGAGLERVICAFKPIVHEGFRRSEDLSFCFRWRNLGQDIWANVAYDIGHTGPHTYASRFLEVATGVEAPKDLKVE